MDRDIQSRKVVGKQIADLRTRRGLSQDALANRLGLHPATIEQLETGQSPIDITLLPSLALALDVRIADIIVAIEPTGTQTLPNFGPLESWKNRIRLALHEITSEEDMAMFAKVLSIIAPDQTDTR